MGVVAPRSLLMKGLDVFMQEIEKIPVFIRIEGGRTVCVCHRSRKKCNRNCEKDCVSRDKFEGWKNLMNRDRFGKSRD